MKRFAITLILATGALIGCSRMPVSTPNVIQAQPATVNAMSESGIRSAVRYTANRVFFGLDKNKDGFLTLDEVERMNRDLIKDADKNHDQKVSLNELLAFYLSPAQIQELRNLANENFSRFDKDHDGVMTLSEFLAGFMNNQSEYGRLMMIFNLADKNHNLKLTGSEFEDVMAWYEAADVSSGPYLPNDPAIPSPIPPNPTSIPPQNQ